MMFSIVQKLEVLAIKADNWGL